MVGMLNPIVAVPIGTLARLLNKHLSRMIWGSKVKTSGHCKYPTKVLRRLFTMSINVYLFLIACSMMYLFASSIQYRVANSGTTYTVKAKHDFTNQRFDQCFCKGEKQNEFKSYCKNHDTNFQNLLVKVPNQWIIWVFMLCPLVFHIIHSLITALPDPIPMLDFILGRKASEDSTEQDLVPEELELPVVQEHVQGNMENNDENPNQIVLDKEVEVGSRAKCGSPIQYVFCVLALLYIAGILAFPASFDILFESVNKTQGKKI